MKGQGSKLDKRTVVYYRDGQVVSRYESARFRGAGGRLVVALQEEAIARALDRTPSSTGIALDAGCGTGRFARLLQSRSFKVVGIDTSEGMLLEARERNPGMECLQADLLHLPFPEGSFAVALTVWVLNHLESYLEAIQELARVAQYVVLAVPSSHSLYSVGPALRNLRLARWSGRGTAAGVSTDAASPYSFNLCPPKLERDMRALGLRVHFAERSMLLPIVPDPLARPFAVIERLLKPISRRAGGFLTVGLTRQTGSHGGLGS